MIEVRVRDEHEIDVRDLRRRQGALHQAQGAERPEQQINTDTRKQRWICQNANAEEVDKDGGMAEPRQRDGILRPGGWRRLVWCRGYLAADLLDTIHQEVESPRTDAERAKTASHAGGHECAAIEQVGASLINESRRAGP